MRYNTNLSKEAQELETTNKDRKHCQNNDKVTVVGSIRAPGERTSCKMLFKEEFRDLFNRTCGECIWCHTGRKAIRDTLGK